MAHSLGPSHGEPSGKFTHAASKSQFSVDSNDSELRFGLRRNGVAGQYRASYAMGSGAHATAYVIEISGHLFQAPVCYYPSRGRWDMAPGYEDSKTPDFYRPITQECVFCHSGRARPIAGTLNSYQTPPFTAEAITCERCHGPVENHLRQPTPGSIVNPAKLSPRARDSVCEQCHLSGEARIPNPGKELSDFHPGEELEEVFSVYVTEDSQDPLRSSALTVISQVQQLALSVCARKSKGKLWCGTCHDPHEQPARPKEYFRARCLACHGAALLTQHRQPNDDCIGCHMPRRPVSDGGHTVFTDHHITRFPASDTAVPSSGQPHKLVPWRSPVGGLAERNLGLAEIQVGERVKVLSEVSDGYRLAVRAWSEFPNDAAVLTGIGQVLLGARHAADAATMFQRAIQIEPGNAAHYFHLALAYKAMHNPKSAIESLEKALALDPLLEQAYRELAGIYSDGTDSLRLKQTYERYSRAFPGNIDAQIGLLKSAGITPTITEGLIRPNPK